ncbi:unnamed protein product [Umbelopsis ramanniana]
MGLFSKPKPSPRPGDAPPPYSNNNASHKQYAPPPPKSADSNPDRRQLPPGWITQKDPNSGKWFYVYTPNAHTQWDHPIDRPLQDQQRGSAASYQGYSQSPYQQPYQQQQQYYQQQPQYLQQQAGSRFGGGRMGGMGGMGGAGLPLAAGLVGGGMLGMMAGEAFDNHDTIVENNYYGDDYNNNDFGGGGDFGGGDFGGGDFGGGF